MKRNALLLLLALIVIGWWFLSRSTTPPPGQGPLDESDIPDQSDQVPSEPRPEQKPIEPDEPTTMYAPGNLLGYGADPTGTTDSSAALQAAIDQAVLPGGAAVHIPAGTYLLTKQVTKDNFSGLVITGAEGAVIDFRVNQAIRLGDHAVAREDSEQEPHYVQSEITGSDIRIEGITFKPGDPGWNLEGKTNRFAYQAPLSFSSVSNVTVRNCRFFDWDFAAIGFNAPSNNILIENSEFVSSQETKVAYGIRVFGFVKGARLNDYDDRTGVNTQQAPTRYHENVRIRNNRFERTSHGIISWNVREFHYSGNRFVNPTTRTLSLSHWNFDGLVENNIHQVEDNSSSTLSTAIVIGLGSERITVRDEKIVGAMSGTAPNDKLKVIHISGVSRDIVVRDTVFDVSNPAANIQIGPNAEVTIENNYFLQKPITRSGYVLSDIYVNDKKVPFPAFDQPPLIIRNNVSLETTRFVTLNGPPAGAASAVELVGNELYSELKNGFLVTSSPTVGWSVLMDKNKFNRAVSVKIRDFGEGKTERITRIDP